MLRRLSITAFVCGVVFVAGCGLMPPATPDEPTGPATGEIGASYEFTAVTYDPQNLPVRYQFVWGDRVSEWSQFRPSGEPVTMAHAWREAGAYAVKVRAENISRRQSDLSPAHSILIGGQSWYPDEVIATIQTPGDPTDVAVLPNGE